MADFTSTILSVNPEMILIARYSRRLTQAELARKIGVSQARVSKLENGLISATNEDLNGLCGALDYPPRFFRRRWELEGPSIHEMYHRKRSRVAASLLNQVYAVATIQREQLNLLLQSTQTIDHDFQAFPVDEFDGDVERVARIVRAMWRLPLGPVENLTRAVERAGGVVVLSAFGTKRIDGMSTWRAQSPPIFWLNRELPPDRWRWTLAHELGHVLLHSEGDSRVEMESEADRFAAEFLLPRAEIKPHLVGLSLMRLAALKRRWKVSMQALIMRAYHLRMITERKRRDLFVALSREGYRIREPVELDPPAEIPSRIDELMRFHTRELGYSESDLTDMLSSNPHDLHQLRSVMRPMLRVVT